MMLLHVTAKKYLRSDGGAPRFTIASIKQRGGIEIKLKVV